MPVLVSQQLVLPVGAAGQLDWHCASLVHLLTHPACPELELEELELEELVLEELELELVEVTLPPLPPPAPPKFVSELFAQAPKARGTKQASAPRVMPMCFTIETRVRERGLVYKRFA
jgi:hypothetical protein